MNKILNKIYFIILSIWIMPAPALAQQNLGSAMQNLRGTGEVAGTTGTSDLPTMIGTIINAALSLVGIIFLILMVYSGYLWMTARGEDEQVSKAKKIISASIVGLVIVVSAYAITFFVTSRFEG